MLVPKYEDVGAILIAAVVVAVVVYGFDKGWLPHDDGYLGWAAGRAADGELPHRDFVEVYTGGLSFLNAWSFELWGESLRSLRIPFLGAFAVFGASIYLIARRFLDRLPAVVAVGTLILLGPFLTATPMPTLYNLFLGALSLYFVVRYVEDQQSFWLVIAGLVVGFSVLIKVTGLYVLLGLSIGLIGHHGVRRPTGRWSLSNALLMGAALAPTALMAGSLTFSRIFALLTPIYAVVALVWVSRDENVAQTSERRLFGSLAILGSASLLPVAGFSAYYAINGALGDLFSGVFGSIQSVSTLLQFDVAAVYTVIIPIGLVGILIQVGRVIPVRDPRFTALAITALLLLWYLVHPRSELLAIYGSLRWLTFLATAVLASAWFKLKPENGADERASRVLLIAGVAVCFQLVQFPSANPWQVAYSVAFGGLLLFVTLSHMRTTKLFAAVGIALLIASVFAFARLQGQVFSLTTFGLKVPYVHLHGEHSGISVPIVHHYYNELTARLDQFSNTEVLLAGPDLPEVYFLSGNDSGPTAIFPVVASPPYSMEAEYRSTSPDVVIINEDPAVSDPEVVLTEKLKTECSLREVYGRLVLFSDCNR